MQRSAPKHNRKPYHRHSGRLYTRSFKANCMKQAGVTHCCHCGEGIETIKHILNQYKKKGFNLYTWRGTIRLCRSCTTTSVGIMGLRSCSSTATLAQTSEGSFPIILWLLSRWSSDLCHLHGLLTFNCMHCCMHIHA